MGRRLFRSSAPPVSAGDNAHASGSISSEAGAAAPLRVGLYGVGGIGFSGSAAATVAPFVGAVYGGLAPSSSAGGDLTASAAGAGTSGLASAIAAALSEAGEGLGAIVVDGYVAGTIGDVGSSASGSVAVHGVGRATSRVVAAAGNSELESAYLPLNGSSQYGFAANALAGITAADTWTTAIKLHDLAAIANGTYGAWLYAYDATVTPINSLHNRVWTLVQYYLGGVYVGKATAAASSVINSLFPGSSTLGVPKVLAITQSPGNVKMRVITAAGIEYSADYPYAAGAPNDRDPLHLAMGAQTNESHAIMVPSQMGTGKNVGVIVAMGETPTDELVGWLEDYDARAHVSDLRNYWPLAATVGSTVPDVVGGSDMTLVAITASSLVQTVTPEGGLSVPATAAAGGGLTASAPASGAIRADVAATSLLEAGSAFAATSVFDGSTEASLLARAASSGEAVPGAAVSATLEAMSATSGSLGPAGQLVGELQALMTSAASAALSGGSSLGVTALGLASQSIRLESGGQGRTLVSSAISARLDISALASSVGASRGAGSASLPLVMDVAGVVVQAGSGAPGFVFVAAAGGDLWVGSDSAPAAYFDLGAGGAVSALGASSGDLAFQAAVFDRLSDLINRYLGALLAELVDADKLTATLESRTHIVSADLVSADTFTATRLF